MWIVNFYLFGLDLDPITMALKIDLDIVKHTESKFLASVAQKL